MRHHALPTVTGLLLAAALVFVSTVPADAASPTGYWRKAQQGQHPAKMLVYRCGSGGRLLCVKIAWLQNPNDSKGKPLHDIRNSNPGLRGRPIQGLQIVKGMQPVAANQWKGSIYNPEDGNTYSATLTLASSSKIVLKGCKAFLLCAERVWLRTSAPPKEEPKPEPQVEAAAEPAEAPETETAAAAPQAATPETDSFADAEVLTPVAAGDTQPGYRFLNASDNAGTPEGFSGESVPSMFTMTTPLEGAAAPAAQSAPAAAQPAPPPQPKPQTAAAPPAPKPVPQPKPAPQAAPAPQPAAAPPAPAPEAVETAETGETEAPAPATTASTTAAQPSGLSLRERIQLRRQQRRATGGGTGGLPWIR